MKHVQVSVGEFHQKRKMFFDQKAAEFLEAYVPNIGDVCYPPDGMKTHFTRRLVKKVDENSYLFFSGYVSDIDETEDGLVYAGEVYPQAHTERCSRTKAIDSIGFGISIRGRFKDLPDMV